MTVSRSQNDSTLNELSTVIGELRNFAAQQTVTNTHMLEELKKISDRMAGFGEVGATFVEYRKTLHERFGKIHEQIASIDEDVEKLDSRMNSLEKLTASWSNNWKLLVGGLTLGATVLSSLMTTYGASILRALIH
jgi:chaperonin cofactor prefoldin